MSGWDLFMYGMFWLLLVNVVVMVLVLVCWCFGVDECLCVVLFLDFYV